MSMPKGLIKANNYYNRLAAWQDWNDLAKRMRAAGHADLVEKYLPAKDAGWRKIDKAIAALKQAVNVRNTSALAAKFGQPHKWQDWFVAMGRTEGVSFGEQR